MHTHTHTCTHKGFGSSKFFAACPAHRIQHEALSSVGKKTAVDTAKTLRVCEPTWYRNARRRIQDARGVLATSKLGYEVPTATLSAANHQLVYHHGTAMQPWLNDLMTNYATYLKGQGGKGERWDNGYGKTK